MDKVERRNAKIEYTRLGHERGLLTFVIGLSFVGGGQGFGQYRLDSWDKKNNRATGCRFTAEMINSILETVGVENWEDLVGKYVRMEATRQKVHRIGHITEDKWCDPEAIVANIKKLYDEV